MSFYYVLFFFCGISYTPNTTAKQQKRSQINKDSSSWLRGLRLTSEWEIECNCKKVRFCYNKKLYTVWEREKGDIIKDLYIFLLLMIENVNFFINMQLCCARVIGGVNCKLCYCTEGRCSQVERKHLFFLCIEFKHKWNRVSVAMVTASASEKYYFIYFTSITIGFSSWWSQNQYSSLTFLSIYFHSLLNYEYLWFTIQCFCCTYILT